VEKEERGMSSAGTQWRTSSRDARWKCEKLRQSRPDLFAQYERGELTLSRAARAAGLEEERFTIARDAAKATQTITARLSASEVDDLLLKLVHQQAVRYGMSAEAYVDELRTAVVEAGAPNSEGTQPSPETAPAS
jgi:hypothetical protein